MSYRNALLRPEKVKPPMVVETTENEPVPNVAPAAAPPLNNTNNNNNANWLQRIKINTPPPEPELFRNVNFPSPPSTPGPENNNWNRPEPELTDEQKRLLAEDPAGFLFLPTNLTDHMYPYYVYSQHYGECATDSFLNILFFADGYRNYFARLADKVYKNLRNEHRYDLLHYTPFFKSEVQRVFQITNSRFSLDDFEKIIDIFARIVRRFIFVMLLNHVGTKIASSLSTIIETECPVRVKERAVRRKSINLMAGIDIHDAILEFMGQDKRKKKNNSNELETKGLGTTEIQLLLSSFMNTIFAPRSKELYYRRLEIHETEEVESSLPFLKAVYLTASPLVGDKAGHAVAIFCFGNTWFLADNNIGKVIELKNFQPGKYFGKGVLSQFFIADFNSLRVREFLYGNHEVAVSGYQYELEQPRHSPFVIERLQKSTFYGFYIHESQDIDSPDKQYVIAASEDVNYTCLTMVEKYNVDDRIYFFAKVPFNAENDYGNENERNNENLPGPMKRNRLKKTKRRPRGRGKNRWTQRAKPARANQTRNLTGQLENVEEASGNAANEEYNEHMHRYFFPKKKGPAKFTLGNFL